VAAGPELYICAFSTTAASLSDHQEREPSTAAKKTLRRQEAGALQRSRAELGWRESGAQKNKICFVKAPILDGKWFILYMLVLLHLNFV
jgi:hypothetical protein